jgi:hypothetical protein
MQDFSSFRPHKRIYSSTFSENDDKRQHLYSSSTYMTTEDEVFNQSNHINKVRK